MLQEQIKYQSSKILHLEQLFAKAEEKMAHDALYKVEQINNRAWGVYKRDFGSAGGWVLIKAYPSEDEAQAHIWILTVE